MLKNLVIDNRIAANTLRRLSQSEKPDVADQARRILDDPVLFAKYVAGRSLRTRARRPVAA
jgi:hypothetical protein